MNSPLPLRISCSRAMLRQSGRASDSIMAVILGLVVLAALGRNGGDMSQPPPPQYVQPQGPVMTPPVSSFPLEPNGGNGQMDTPQTGSQRHGGYSGPNYACDSNCMEERWRAEALGSAALAEQADRDR